MKTYSVTVSVERHNGHPVAYLGSATFTVDADSAEQAEAAAISAISEKFAVGGKWIAQADEWEQN